MPRLSLLLLFFVAASCLPAQNPPETSVPDAMGCTGYTGFPDLTGWTHEEIVLPGSHNRGWTPYFLNLRTGFLLAADGQLQRTSDGGLTWAAIAPPAGLSIKSLFFVDSLRGFAGAYRTPLKTDTTLSGVVLTTSDGGRSWSEISGQPGGVPHNLHFFDLKNGLALLSSSAKGSNAWISTVFLARTADGGATWTQVKGPEPAQTGAAGLEFVDARFAYFAGNKGLIYRTLDGGKTWKPVETGLDQVLSVQFTDPQHGFAYGHNKLLRTTDGGATWTVAAERLVDFFHFFSPLEGISIQAIEVCGYGNHLVRDNAFFITRDGGATWINGNASRNFSLKRIFFLDKDHAFSSIGTRPGSLVRLKRSNRF
jgi:photosystem II stability/assembly factor-like uncharacterized protein